jgi:O-antigen ligase
MAALVVALIALGTLAFGAVYPWGFLPLFAAAALIGIVGLSRGGIPRQMRSVAIAILLLCAAVAAQLLPIPQSTLERLSPHAVPILSSYSLTFTTTRGEGTAPLSIDPRSTQVALLAAGALGLYLLGLPALFSGHSLRSLPRALAVFAVPLALFAIYSRESRNGLIYWFWQPQDGGGANLAGPFVNRNHFAGWMLMTVCLLIGWLFGQVERAMPDGGGRRGRRLEWLSSAEANGLVLTGGVVLVAAISLFWTLSRSAILGFTAGAAAFAWLVLRRRRLGTTRRVGVLAGLGAVMLAAVAWRGPAQLVMWFQDAEHLVGRVEAWRDAWQVVRDFPLFGTGLNTYSTAMLFYQKSNTGYHMAQAHNDYVQMLAEGGLLVTIPAALVVALLARAIRRNLRAAEREARGYWIRAGAAVGMLAIGVQEVFEFSLQIPANALLLCTLAAVALTPVGRIPSASSSREARRG